MKTKLNDSSCKPAEYYNFVERVVDCFVKKNRQQLASYLDKLKAEIEEEKIGEEA